MTETISSEVADQEDVLSLLNSDPSAPNPIHEIRKTNDPTVLDALIARGADVNACDEDGRTALHIAAWNDRYNMAAALLKKGAAAELSK